MRPAQTSWKGDNFSPIACTVLAASSVALVRAPSPEPARSAASGRLAGRQRTAFIEARSSVASGSLPPTHSYFCAVLKRGLSDTVIIRGIYYLNPGDPNGVDSKAAPASSSSWTAPQHSSATLGSGPARRRAPPAPLALGRHTAVALPLVRWCDAGCSHPRPSPRAARPCPPLPPPPNAGDEPRYAAAPLQSRRHQPQPPSSSPLVVLLVLLAVLVERARRAPPPPQRASPPIPPPAVASPVVARAAPALRWPLRRSKCNGRAPRPRPRASHGARAPREPRRVVPWCSPAPRAAPTPPPRLRGIRRRPGVEGAGHSAWARYAAAPPSVARTRAARHRPRSAARAARARHCSSRLAPG
eukprot:scaffold36559_cov58-Phaeocystis_antarctica.AAC.2